MARLTRFALAACIGCSCLAAPAFAQVPASPSQTEDQAAYGDIVARGVAEFNAGRFAEARALFLQAHESWPSARTWRSLGMTAFELRLYPQALTELQAALDDARRPLPDDLRDQVQALIAQTRPFVGRYRVRASPANAELLVDGTQHSTSEPVVLAVGAHDLLARAPGYRALERRLVVQGREDQELELVLEPQGATAVVSPAPASASAKLPTQGEEPAPGGLSPTRVAAFTALGVGTAAFITAGVFAGLSLSQKGELSDQCPDKACPPEYDEQRRDMQRFADYATLGVAVGAAGVATFAVLWLTAPKVSQQASRSSLLPWVGAGTAGVAGRF